MPMIGGLRFRLVTGRIEHDSDGADRRRTGGHEALALLDRHLATRDFLVGDGYSIADIAVYAYSHVAEAATVDAAGYPNFPQLARPRGGDARIHERPRAVPAERIDPGGPLDLRLGRRDLLRRLDLRCCSWSRASPARS